MGNNSQTAGDFQEPQLPEGHFQVRISVYKLDITGVGFLDSIVAGSAGAYHSGLVVGGEEWSYGGHDDPCLTGVYPCDPEMNPNYTFYKRVIMGNVKATKLEITQKIQSLARSPDWIGTTYELMEHNCNHWTSDICWAVMRKRPPDWINDTANSFARNRRKKRVLEDALEQQHSVYVAKHRLKSASGEVEETPGEEAFRLSFRNTFAKAFERRLDATKGQIEACQLGTDPEEIKQRLEADALEQALRAATAAADAVSAAARAAAEERKMQPAEGLLAWDSVWARESGALLRAWQDAAVRGELQGPAQRAEQTSRALASAQQAAAEHIERQRLEAQAAAQAAASGRDHPGAHGGKTQNY